MTQLSKRISSTEAYAFAELDKKVEELKAKGIDVIDFGVGDPTAKTPNFIREACQVSVDHNASSGYPSYIGLLEFREAAARYMQRNFNVTLDPETEICSTIGSKEAIFNFPLAFINPDDYVIVPTPGYPPYKTGTRFAGGEVYFTPLLSENNFLIDYSKIPAEIISKTKIIWLNYPNSPTGKIASRQYLEGLVTWAQKNDIIIAADEGCYIDIYFGAKPTSILEIDRRGIIAFYSLSKRNNMTGYRVGFVCGDEKIISAFKKVKTNIDSGTPFFIQDAAIAALRDDTSVNELRKEYKEKMEIMLSAFQELGFETQPSDGTFYIWQKVSPSFTSVTFAEKLLSPEIGIVVAPGKWISDQTTDGINPGDDYIRIALVPSLEKVKEAAERLRANFT